VDNAFPDVTDAQIARAAERLQRGELVAFPTETVYGLGADAENREAVARIYAAKGRPSNHPVIVHIAPDARVDYWTGPVPALAQTLIQAFWPGPLTLILKRAAHIDPAVSGGQDSIGLRCPSHPVAKRLLLAFAAQRPNGQGGVAAPSANTFGHVSPTQAAHVRSEFPREVAAGMLVLDGGSADVGIESTIVDLSRLDQGVGPVLLRPGHVTAAQIEAVTGVAPALPDAGAPRASGTLKAHYAPRTPLASLPLAELLAWLAGPARDAAGMVAVLALRPAPAGLPPGVHWTALSADPERYARAIYRLLRELDGKGYGRILLETPPAETLWDAVNDRVGRAAAAFPQPGGAGQA
jgi:L-threonylcarbamoyladenylate synthase